MVQHSSHTHDRRLGYEVLESRQMLAATTAGDYNVNGFVDAADFIMWRAAARTGSTGTDIPSRPQGYDTWRTNFSRQSSGQPGSNWFDASVYDAALRSLGHNLYLDSLIDRNDIIALLTSATDGGAVDAIEFTDLKAIVNNTSLFGSLDYVRQLSSYVVFGNAANAHYQTTTLGNLAAGSPASQLQNLVNKWFLGLDRPTTPFTYALTSGTLFVGGASYTDINQGNLSDCYLLTSLAETALKSSATIANMFVVNGDGTYTVKIYNNSQAAYVTVDSYLPVDAAGNLVYAGIGKSSFDANNELWVSLAEKAYAQINEIGWLRGLLPGNGQNSYAAIENGYIYAALGQISGQTTVAFSSTLVATNFSAFVDAYNQGKSIGFSSMRTPTSTSVVGDHAYAVVQYDAVHQTITLFNPWGIQHGLLTLTWAEIQGNFSYFDRTA